MIRPSDIHSVSTFTRNARKLIQQVKETKNPIAITVNGEAEVIILDAATYQAEKEAAFHARIMEGIRRGEDDIANGRFKTLDETSAEINQKLGL